MTDTTALMIAAFIFQATAVGIGIQIIIHSLAEED